MQIIILVIAITLIVVFKLILLWSNFYSTFIVKCIPTVPGQYPKYLSIFLRPVKSLYWSHFSYARQVSEGLFLPTPLECTTESLVSFPSWGTPLWRDYLVCYSDITMVYGNGLFLFYGKAGCIHRQLHGWNIKWLVHHRDSCLGWGHLRCHINWYNNLYASCYNNSCA